MKADLILLLTAAIWGFAFVAQRVGMDHMGPFVFNAIRFSLGALSLLPVLFYQNRYNTTNTNLSDRRAMRGAVWTGLALFAGASLQQVGLMGTTAGKAGFITGLYVILVPLLSLLWGRRTHLAHWGGAAVAVTGLYLLTVQGGFIVSTYDLIVLTGAFVWAIHVHLVARYSDPVGPIRLSIIQFAICGALSMLAATLFESIQIEGIRASLWPILYGSFLSVGLAYTLQVVAQRTADPAHAVIILSLEGAFAALGGWLVLQEVLTARHLIGCFLMLIGTLISQVLGNRKKTRLFKAGASVRSKDI